MRPPTSIWVLLLAVTSISAASGQDASTLESGNAVHNRRAFLQSWPETDTLTNDWFGEGDRLRESGITSTLNLWTVYQANVSGGLSKQGGLNGVYWFANHFDLEALIGLEGASAYALVEGGWNDGINASAGSLMNVNGTGVGDQAIGVPRFWLEQKLFGDRLRVRGGKLDVSLDNFDFYGHSVGFDAMPFANAPRTQFLDGGLVNNSAIPFPAAGLAGMLLVEPVDRWYLAAAALDRNTDAFETNFSNAFDEWMITLETGVVVPLGKENLQGLYYAGYWHSTFDGSPDGNGVYLGVAQQLTRESMVTDGQGLGVFARYGYADSIENDVSNFWSLGLQYEGLLPNRDKDVVALGWAQAFTSGAEFSAPSEGVLECYYRASISPWFHLSPHLQYIANPGSNAIADAVTVGVRGQITF